MTEENNGCGRPAAEELDAAALDTVPLTPFCTGALALSAGFGLGFGLEGFAERSARNLLMKLGAGRAAAEDEELPSGAETCFPGADLEDDAAGATGG